MTLPFKLDDMNNVIDHAINTFKHNVIIIWGELGEGKTTLMLKMLYRKIQDWTKVLSFELEPHVCAKCGHTWDAEAIYQYEVPCAKCDNERRTTDIGEAVAAVRQRQLVLPFPLDRKTGFPAKFRAGTVFELHSSPARGKIVQKYPYLNFSFFEFRQTVQNAVNTRIREPIIGWDDVAVYFHRSNIQYMHPEVKNFFSRYNFVREYIANVVITVPTIDFVPEQLGLFCTADVLLSERGVGDFDTKKPVRNFWGAKKSFMKSYDGFDVTWDPAPEREFKAYEEIRHAHAIEAFEHPEEVLITSMPQRKQFTEQESLLE